MSIQKPFRRTCRQLVDGSYTHDGNGRYVQHEKYAKEPELYVRAFLLLQKDLQELFDYIEPAHANCGTYSFRTQALLLRACAEVEANFKAILQENGYKRSGNWNISDYEKINLSHHLSSYEIKVPYWRGKGSVRAPFAAWSRKEPLGWYQAYNATKHDRHTSFPKATFESALDAICGALVLLSSQFICEDFSPTNSRMMLENSSNDGFEEAIGSYFRVKFPTDWKEEDKYHFSWRVIQGEEDPFQDFSYAG